VIAPWVVVDPFHDDNGNVRFWTGPHLTAARDVSCDGKGRELLLALEKGATVHSFSQTTGLPTQQVADLLEDLVREGIVCERTPFPPELQRYSRHMLFYQILGMEPVAAQQRLASARVIVLGMGGIGTNVSLGLITAGIGDLTIV